MHQTETSEKRRGRVIWFKPEKGYGFLRDDQGGVDIFVHYSGIDADGYGKGYRRNLLPDQVVEFYVLEGQKGPLATNVRVIDE